MREFNDIYIDLMEFPIPSNNDEVQREIEFDGDYTHIVGISANTVTDQRADVVSCQLEKKQVLFKNGVNVEDTFASHPVAGAIDRFFPCELEIRKDQKFVLKLKDTTDGGDFTAHTRKVYLLLVRR